MDLGHLRELLAGGETLTIEFKSDTRPTLSDDDLVEAVVCLANGEGGMILVGVEDNSEPTGLGKRRIAETDDQVRAMIFNKTDPPQQCLAERITTEAGDILIVPVSKAARAIVATTSGKCVRRVLGTRGPECKPFPPSQHVSRLTDLGLLDYSAHALADSSLKDKDPSPWDS